MHLDRAKGTVVGGVVGREKVLARDAGCRDGPTLIPGVHRSAAFGADSAQIDGDPFVGDMYRDVDLDGLVFMDAVVVEENDELTEPDRRSCK